VLLQKARAKGRGGRRTRPYAFTEQGVSMLSTVLESEGAIEVNIAIIRSSAGARCSRPMAIWLVGSMNLNRRTMISGAIRVLMAPERVPASRRIGFTTKLVQKESDE
jgi:hypothetical protein